MNQSTAADAGRDFTPHASPARTCPSNISGRRSKLKISDGLPPANVSHFHAEHLGVERFQCPKKILPILQK